MKKHGSKWKLLRDVFVLTLAVFSGNVVAAQDTQKAEAEHIYPAEFKGGNRNFEKYFEKNFHFTTGKNNKDGVIYASFTITKEGKIEEVYIDKGMNKEYDNEAYNCLKNMPDLLPAEKAKQAVESKAYLKIIFGKSYGMIIQKSPIDYAFRGVLIIDNQVVDYGEKLYDEDWQEYYSQVNNPEAASFALYGNNKDLISIYGGRAAEGVRFIMNQKFPIVMEDGKEENIMRMATSRYIANSVVSVLSAEEATKKYGLKGKDGAILID